MQPATDAPRPLSPEESAERVQLPPGFRLELAASEPLIREPSGVCWDEHGRLFVCELHGYNLEGQFDIEALNKTGQLDREVRRIQANSQAKEAAQAGTYGTVKLLRDSDGDGRADQAQIFADNLPPCYGLCPARGGLIVACAPDIVYLADRDGDGRAEVRETLFTGFATGALERGINQPQWGLDDWIYFGRGHGGGLISGPHLQEPVRLGGTDFRIKADGSAIEPIIGSTHTFGHAFTESGERFTSTTSVPGLYVTPLPWRYLSRNPEAASPRTEQTAGDYTRVFPISAPHPWRTKRAQDPGFFKYYRDRYGAGDSDAGGWFTSACGPLVYQDVALPREVRGQYFVCEPAQNLIHRARIERDGPALRLRRAPGEEAGEFLASSDPWFHPIHLAHGPDGAIWIVDMYREIIEDYSAIPRYLQQQYGLTNGATYGRLWRLTHRDAPRAPSAKMGALSAEALVKEIASSHFWRRQTARRLLVERKLTSAGPALSQYVREAKEPAVVLNALYALGPLGALEPQDVLAALEHSAPAVRLHGLRFSERWLETEPSILQRVLSFHNERDPSVLLQWALTLGESNDPRALTTLTELAHAYTRLKWMPNAILSSLRGRAGLMLERLLKNAAAVLPVEPTPMRTGIQNRAGQAGGRSYYELLEPLCASIGARRDDQELTQALVRLAAALDPDAQRACLRGLQTGLRGAGGIVLSGEGRKALGRFLASADADVRGAAAAIAASLKLTDPAQVKALVAQAAREAADAKSAPEIRLAAVAQLAGLDDAGVPKALLAAWKDNTPKLRDAILDALFSRRDWLPELLEALEHEALPPAALSAFQRLTLMENEKAAIRERAAKLLARPARARDATFRLFASALAAPRDLAHGERVFRDHCAACHQTRGIGTAVGPDLGAEFQRAEEAILKDILAPNETISAGYLTYTAETTTGQSVNGVLVSESATSVTLRQAAGVEQTVLRKDIVRVASLPVSLMPEALAETIQPKDAADLIAWLRNAEGTPAPSTDRAVLFDDETDLVSRLGEGAGRAEIEAKGAFSGEVCLAVSPPQRYSARIAGWRYRIAEKPQAGEYRFLRLAWRTQGGQGVMLELAADGRWPEANDPRRRYFAGKNTTKWSAREVSPDAPTDWHVVTVDLWKDNGSFVLTGIAPTALGGKALFDRIELLRSLTGLEGTAR
ncbi:MAG: c-type cytochrome [Verrucomicrobia bacterium]|nr:c-type cytochrome [Verrucomicrobiota bacterium]